jgi:hypothetical protein
MVVPAAATDVTTGPDVTAMSLTGAAGLLVGVV